MLVLPRSALLGSVDQYRQEVVVHVCPMIPHEHRQGSTNSDFANHLLPVATRSPRFASGHLHNGFVANG